MNGGRSRTAWREAVLRDRTLRESTRVFLLPIADRHMKPNRMFCVPREQLAQELNRSTRRIDQRIADAVAKQFLLNVSPGYRGHTAEYQGTFPGKKSATERSAQQSAMGAVALASRESATAGGRTTTRATLTVVGRGSDDCSDKMTAEPWRGDRLVRQGGGAT